MVCNLGYRPFPVLAPQPCRLLPDVLVAAGLLPPALLHMLGRRMVSKTAFGSPAIDETPDGAMIERQGTAIPVNEIAQHNAVPSSCKQGLPLPRLDGGHATPVRALETTDTNRTARPWFGSRLQRQRSANEPGRRADSRHVALEPFGGDLNPPQV